jgi:formate dehydrogenase major subunit
MLTRKSKAHSQSKPEAGVVLAANPAANFGANSASTVANNILATTMDRRTFLKRSGLVAGGGAMATQLPYNMIGSAEAADVAKEKTGVEIKRTVCTHCSVGCAVDAMVENGVWVRQEPVFDSPINLGAHCAKGAAVREHGHGEHRLKYPMKLVDGKYKKISWEQALNEIGDKLLPSARKAARMRPTGSARRSTATSRPTCCASSCPSSAPTTWTTRPASATRPRSRRRQYLGLWRDDQLLQRHAVFQGGVVHRLERGRGAPGVDAAHAARQGKRLQDGVVDPRFTRTAAKADYFRASVPAPTFPSSGACFTTSSRTAGKTRSTSRPACMASTRSRKK